MRQWIELRPVKKKNTACDNLRVGKRHFFWGGSLARKNNQILEIPLCDLRPLRSGGSL